MAAIGPRKGSERDRDGKMGLEAVGVRLYDCRELAPGGRWRPLTSGVHR